MKRILVLLTVALVMAATLAATAMPALAKNIRNPEGGPPFESGSPGGTTVYHCTGPGPGQEGAQVLNKNGLHGGGDCVFFE